MITKNKLWSANLEIKRLNFLIFTTQELSMMHRKKDFKGWINSLSIKKDKTQGQIQYRGLLYLQKMRLNNYQRCLQKMILHKITQMTRIKRSLITMQHWVGRNLLNCIWIKKYFKIQISIKNTKWKIKYSTKANK